MPYIGKQLVRGQNRKLDDISSGFNGSQTTFTLQVASQNVTVGSALQLWISLGGVIQDPLSDYTIAGNQITFTTAPAASLDFFGVIQGDVTDTNTPGDATVTTSKLSTGLTVNLADGSAATSSLQLGGTDSGLFSSAADKVNVTTGGVERLEIGDSEVVFNDPSNDVDFRVESNGNTHMLFVNGGNDRVGIGASSPSATLHAKSGTTDVVADFESTDANAWIQIRDNSTTDTAVMVGAVGDHMRLRAGSNERVRIDSSGNVGIGTTSPSALLHISKQVNSGDVGLIIQNTGTSSQTASLYLNKGSGGEPDHRIQNDTGGNLTFARGTNESSKYTEQMRIDSSGRLLIGTTTEGHVSADNFTVADSGHCGITIRSGTTSEGAIYFSDGTSGDAEYRGQVLYDHDGDYMRFSTAVTERLRITSTGRMGLGITSPQQRQHIHEGSTAASVTQYTNSVTGSTANDGLLVGLDSTEDGLFWMKESNNLTFGTSNTERMRINSSGQVGIGTSSPNVYGVHANDSSNSVYFKADSSAVSTVYGSASSLGVGLFGTFSNNALAVYTNSAERMRMTTSGSLLVGRTAAYNSSPGETGVFQGAAHGVVIYQTANANYTNIILRNTYANNGGNNVSANMITFTDQGGTERGKIAMNGSSTSYITSSDYRLKENVVDINDGITRVKQLQPKRFNFIVDADTTVDGFLAHEAQTVVPEAVTGTHNEVDDDNNPVYQGIDQSKLVPLLTAALQEAIAKIETLETKVAALEAE